MSSYLTFQQFLRVAAVVIVTLAAAVAVDDAVVLEACRRIWTENRQHFFVPTKSPQLPASSAPDVPAGFMKSQERIQPGEIDQSGTR